MLMCLIVAAIPCKWYFDNTFSFIYSSTEIVIGEFSFYIFTLVFFFLLNIYNKSYINSFDENMLKYCYLKFLENFSIINILKNSIRILIIALILHNIWLIGYLPPLFGELTNCWGIWYLDYLLKIKIDIITSFRENKLKFILDIFLIWLTFILLRGFLIDIFLKLDLFIPHFVFNFHYLATEILNTTLLRVFLPLLPDILINLLQFFCLFLKNVFFNEILYFNLNFGDEDLLFSLEIATNNNSYDETIISKHYFKYTSESKPNILDWLCKIPVIDTIINSKTNQTFGVKSPPFSGSRFPSLDTDFFVFLADNNDNGKGKGKASISFILNPEAEEPEAQASQPQDSEVEEINRHQFEEGVRQSLLLGHNTQVVGESSRTQLRAQNTLNVLEGPSSRQTTQASSSRQTTQASSNQSIQGTNLRTLLPAPRPEPFLQTSRPQPITQAPYSHITQTPSNLVNTQAEFNRQSEQNNTQIYNRQLNIRDLIRELQSRVNNNLNTLFSEIFIQFHSGYNGQSFYNEHLKIDSWNDRLMDYLEELIRYGYAIPYRAGTDIRISDFINWLNDLLPSKLRINPSVNPSTYGSSRESLPTLAPKSGPTLAPKPGSMLGPAPTPPSSLSRPAPIFYILPRSHPMYDNASNGDIFRNANTLLDSFSNGRSRIRNVLFLPYTNITLRYNGDTFTLSENTLKSKEDGRREILLLAVVNNLFNQAYSFERFDLNYLRFPRSIRDVLLYLNWCIEEKNRINKPS